MVEKVEAYKTNDGAIFLSQGEAATHQARREFVAWLGAIDTPGGSDSDWADFLVNNAKAIHATLDPIVQATKGPAMRAVR